MKVLLLNGSPNEKGCTYTALQEVAATLEQQGIETELFYPGKQAHVPLPQTEPRVFTHFIR